MATNTREKLIRSAHDLFYAEGFHLVGLDRILGDVGVTKSTFYNRFESKDALNEAFCDTGYNGYIFVNVAVEFPLPQDPAHQVAAEHKLAMEDILREIAGYAGAPDPGTMAQELALLMEGAYVTRQVSCSDQTADVARRLVESLIERHLPAA